MLTGVIAQLNSLDQRVETKLNERQSGLPPDIDKEFRTLRKSAEQAELHFSFVSFLAKLAGAFIAVVAILQLFFNWLRRSEVKAEMKLQQERAAARDEQMNQLVKLYMGGEKEAQGRARDQHNILIDQGAKTVTLVNETLELAKQASEQAESAMNRKVETLLREFDREASIFIATFSNKDNRDIVNNISSRDELGKLIHSLERVEQGNSLLQRPPALMPSCLFIKALAHFIEEQFELSIEVLQRILNKPPEEVPAIFSDPMLVLDRISKE